MRSLPLGRLGPFVSLPERRRRASSFRGQVARRRRRRRWRKGIRYAAARSSGGGDWRSAGKCKREKERKETSRDGRSVNGGGTRAHLARTPSAGRLNGRCGRVSRLYVVCNSHGRRWPTSLHYPSARFLFKRAFFSFAVSLSFSSRPRSHCAGPSSLSFAVARSYGFSLPPPLRSETRTPTSLWRSYDRSAAA